MANIRVILKSPRPIHRRRIVALPIMRIPDEGDSLRHGCIRLRSWFTKMRWDLPAI